MGLKIYKGIRVNWIITRTLSFFVDSVPSWNATLAGGPVCLLWSVACLYCAGYCKKYRGFKTGYSRKLFHFLIFMSAAVIQWIWGIKIVCLFGSMCTLVIFYAIFRGNGNLLYEAMAREKDEPHRTHYIIVPFFATLIGGLASNILFGQIAVIGYLVTGLGDAVGEPVGTRFGKHTYKVPSLTSVKAIRSWEGSAAVFVMSLLAIVGGIFLIPELEFSRWSLLMIPVLGLICTLTEAVSPHGWDNTTMQVIPSFLAEFFLGTNT